MNVMASQKRNDINTDSEYFTPKEIGKLLHIGKVAVNNLCEQPDFPCISIGNFKRINKELFYEWEKKQLKNTYTIEDEKQIDNDELDDEPYDVENSPFAIKPTHFDNGSDYFTQDEICEILSIGRNTSSKLIRTSGFPSIVIGKRNLINKEQFYIWLSNHIGKSVNLKDLREPNYVTKPRKNKAPAKTENKEEKE